MNMTGEIAQDLFLVLPFLVVAIGSLVLLMLDVFSKDLFGSDEWPSSYFALFVLILSLLATVFVAPEYRAQETAFNGTIAVDPFTSFVTVLILASATLCLLVGKDYLRSEGVSETGEYASLYLMATAGALIFVSAYEFVTLFIGLEVMSMALYAMCGSALHRRSSAESAMKYFFLGSFSSGFLLFGMALLYGVTGSFSLIEIASVLDGPPSGMVALGIGLMLMGLLFKIGAVPLHFWAPDVYQGAPSPVTVYMATVVKTSAVVVGLRVMWLTFGGEDIYELWKGAVWISALLTMVVGNVIALRQRSVKRMLAYSSIAHAGYMLMGFLAPVQYGSHGSGYLGAEYGGGPAILFYLVVYTVMTLGAFGVVLAVSSEPSDGSDEDSDVGPDDIRRFNNLGAKKPWLAALMGLFLLSLAGLPPGMAGLLGKFYVFNAAVKADYVGLAIIGVLSSVVSCYYYLRVIVAMYFVPAEEGENSEESSFIVSPPLAGTLAVCAVLTVVLGVQPSFLYDAVVTLF